MESNPYTPPETDDLDPSSATRIQYRVFTIPSFTFRLSVISSREEVRKRAQWAIEHEIGAEHVVAIIEHPARLMSNFEIVVWYRAC